MSLLRMVALPILLCSLLAAAQEAEDEPETEKTTEKTTEKKKPKLKLSGRIFVRETFAEDERGDRTAQTTIASARLGLRSHWKGLRTRLEVELRKSSKLRSAYLELAPTAWFSVRAGLFKIPLSPLELTSSWVLPVADRGLISGILRDRLQVAGRRVGAAVVWTPSGAAEDTTWPFRARAGYFQGVTDLGDLLDGAAADGFGKVGAARVELGPFGVSGEIREGQPQLLGPLRTAWAASADATAALAGLRLWLEATLGSSWLVAEPTRDEALFLEARGLAAGRLGGAKRGAAYVEPYVQLGLVDPDRELADDVVLEATAGINAGAWQRWRLQVEVEIWRFGSNVPAGFVAPASAPVDRTAVVIQLGAAF